MPAYYLAWRCSATTPPVHAPFEYLIHSMGTTDASTYCTALVEASDKDAARRIVGALFNECSIVYLEAADQARLDLFASARQAASTRLVAPEGGD